jgi:enoyl-CoA hydratase/carnithine racemase
LRKTKETLARVAELHDLAEVIEVEARTQAECMRDEHFDEALRAFAEKRPPRFAAGQAG